MKKLFLLSIIIFLGATVLFQCKKKDDSPAPTPPVTATPGTGSLTFNGSTSSLSAGTPSTAGGRYSLHGMGSSGYPMLNIQLPGGKPTGNKSYNIATDDVSIGISSSSSSVWFGTSGTLTVSVSGSIVTVSFTDASFTDYSTTKSASGSLTVE